MGNHSEEQLEALREARRKAADQVRALLAQLEAAEHDFAVATERITAFLAEAAAKKASEKDTPQPGPKQERGKDKTG